MNIKELTLNQLKELVKNAIEEAKADPKCCYLTVFNMEEDDGDTVYWTYLVRRTDGRFNIRSTISDYDSGSRFPDESYTESENIFTNLEELTEEDLEVAKYFL